MINNKSLVAQKPPIFIRVLRRLMSLLGKVTVTGSEHLNGPLGKVIVCNHVGYVDPLWVGYAVLPRTLHQMAKKELFDNPISGWFVRSGGGFPVDRASPSTATIKHAVSLVEQGGLVLIFPVGTRNQDNADAKRGAATIALRAKGEIVPAHYDGPDRFRWIHLLRRPLIRITFGTPLVIPKDVSVNKATAQQLTSELDQAMTIVSQQGRPG
ncbi:1-acyl-sn-glycerol-3-phosphate acyltransferase [Massilia sp. CCM 8734]|nr:1-acyl-sn-glycerol-3-phosphate acyltransferase [Massilia sp. CCM 8734]